MEYWVKKLECGGDVEKQWSFKKKFVDKLKKSEIAEHVDKANEQHYEVPTEFHTTVSIITWILLNQNCFHVLIICVLSCPSDLSPVVNMNL